MQQIFFKKGAFEPELLRYAEQVKQTTHGRRGHDGRVYDRHAGAILPRSPFRYATVLLLPDVDATLPCASIYKHDTNTSTLQFFVGEFDFPFCYGDCKNTYDLTTLQYLFRVLLMCRSICSPAPGMVWRCRRTPRRVTRSCLAIWRLMDCEITYTEVGVVLSSYRSGIKGIVE